MNKLSTVVDMTGVNEGRPETDKPMTSFDVTANVCKNIMFAYAQGTRGLTGEERKQYNRICKALDEAIKGSLEVVELDDQDAGFLKKCRREARMMPSDVLERVENNIDAMVRIKE
jgi:hypothetical protein